MGSGRLGLVAVLGGALLTASNVGCAKNSLRREGLGEPTTPLPAGDHAASEDGAEAPPARSDAGGPPPSARDAAPSEPPPAPAPCQQADGGGDVATPGALIFSEIMGRPAGDGEWLELYNAGSTAVELQGCEVTKDGDDALLIEAPLRLEPGGYVVLGEAEVEQFTPDYVYTQSWSLSSRGETLVLTCADVELDRVTYTRDDTALGASTQLDARYAARGLNDTMDLWCLASQPIAGGRNLGTPGADNAPCPVAPPGDPAPTACE